MLPSSLAVRYQQGKGGQQSKPEAVRCLLYTRPPLLPAVININHVCTPFLCPPPQVGKVLTISRASLKPRNAKFNSTPHDFEIYLERNSQVAPCEDDADTQAIPHIMFSVSGLTFCC
jgi:hypothetical protein